MRINYPELMAGRTNGRDDLTTITIRRVTRDRLASKKIHPNESFDELLNTLLDQLIGPVQEG